MPKIDIRVRPVNPAHPWGPEVSFYHPDTYIAPLPAHVGSTRLQNLLQRNCPRVALPARKRNVDRYPLDSQHPTTEFTPFSTTHTGSLLFPSLLNHTREHLFLHIWNLKRIILDHEDEIQKLQRFVDEDRDMLRWKSSNLRFQYASMKFLNKQLRDRDTDIEKLRQDYAALQESFDEQTETIDVLEEEEATLAGLQEELVSLRKENRRLGEEVEMLRRMGIVGEFESRGSQNPQRLDSQSPRWSNVQEPGTSQGQDGAEVEQPDEDRDMPDHMLELGDIGAGPHSPLDLADGTPEIEVGEQPERGPTPSEPSEPGSIGSGVSVMDRVRKFEALSAASATPVEPVRKALRYDDFGGGMASGA